MKIIRQRFPKIRTYLLRQKRRYEVDARGFGLGHCFYFTDKKAALTKAKELASALRPPASLPPTVHKPIAVADFPVDKLVEKIVHLLQNPAPRSAPPVPELLTKWVQSKSNDKLKPIRHRTLTSLRFMASRFHTFFGELPLHQITTAKIESVFSTLDVSPQSFAHYRNYLHQFFSWLNRRGLMDHNPAKNVQVARVQHEVRIYTLEQVGAMLTLAKTDDYRSLVPSLTLGLFGGLRPFEVQQMTWKDNIHWEVKEVQIQPAITKTKRPRRFQMEPLLVKWLEWFRSPHSEDPLIGANFKERMDKFKKALPFEWIPDGLRHSFGTYHYNRTKDLGRLTFMMGNSEWVARKHYLTTLPQRDVDKFWEITPES